MGQSFDGFFGYGFHIEYEQEIEWLADAPPPQVLQDEDGDKYEERTLYGEHEDFSDWLDAQLGIGPYTDYPDYKAYMAAQKAAQVAAFGCEVDEHYTGASDYSGTFFHCTETYQSKWGAGIVKPIDPERIETVYRPAMLKLAAMLGIKLAEDEPALYYGCSVG